MCFIINEKAKRPEKGVVWKVLRYEYGVLRSPYRGVKWDIQTGRAEISKAARTSEPSLLLANQRCAKEGIYVFLTEKAARVRCAEFLNAVVVKLYVSPADFLFTDGKGVATYRAVTIAERGQPDIKFYYE